MNCSMCKQFSSVYVKLADGRQLCEACDYFVDAERERRGKRITNLERQLEEAAKSHMRVMDGFMRVMDELEKAEADLATERERLDWLDAEIDRENQSRRSGKWGAQSLFRRNEPITRASIDAAREKEKG